MSVSTRLRDLSIRSKLVVAFASLMVLLLATGGIAVQRLSAIGGDAQLLSSNYALAIGYVGDMRQAVMAYRASFYRALALDQPIEQLDAALAQTLERLDRAEAKYAPTVDTAEERAIYDAYRKNWAQYRQATAPVHGLLATGKREDAAAVLRDAAQLGDQIEADLHRDVEFNNNMIADLAGRISAQVSSGSWIVVMALLTAVAFAVLAGWTLVRAIGLPIRRITDAMRRLADRDLATEVTGVDRGDEVGAMANAVQVFKDNMIAADRLAAEQAAEQAAKQQRAARLDTLVGDFEAKVAGLVQALAAASGQMESTARAMAANAERTTEQAAAVSGSADAASTGAQAVASAAEELTASIGEISRQVDQSSKITSEAVAAAEKTDAIVHALADGANKIGDVVGLIASIAGQTNLLALNATIEAARAGDAGKGFAVVASEVKSLANQTAKATEEISGQIGQIQTATKEAVAAIRDITETISQVSAIAATIASAVEEQGSATAEIARSVQATAGNAEAVRGHIADVSEAAAETGSAAGQVLESAGHLSHQADDLSREVSGFVAGVRAA